MRTCMRGLLALAVVVGPMMVQGADWPQWGGPAGNGISPEKGLLKTWPKGGPPLLWTCEDVGTGYTAPVVVGGTVYLMGARKGDEYVISLNDQGKENWSAKVGKVYDFAGNLWSGGPNAAPAIRGEYLVALGSQGELVCVNPANGKPYWNKSLPNQLGGQVNGVGGGGPLAWGFCAAPRIDGDQVIVTPGGPQGLIAALELKTGNVLWQSKGATDQTTYAAPIVAEIGGVKMVIAMTQDGAVGVSAKDGSVLWTHKQPNPYPDVVSTSPLVKDNQVLLSVGYNAGAELLELTQNAGKFTVKVVWANKEIGNRQGGVVLVDKSLYGSHENRNWVCQDWATGMNNWTSTRPPRGLGVGSLIYADGNLICLAEEKGEVALLDASPAGYKENGRFPLPQQSKLRKQRGKVWTHPVLSNGLLFLRDQELLFCYNLKAKAGG